MALSILPPKYSHLQVRSHMVHNLGDAKPLNMVHIAKVISSLFSTEFGSILSLSFAEVGQATNLFLKTYVPRLYFNMKPYSHMQYVSGQDYYTSDHSFYDGFSLWQNDTKNEFYNYVSIISRKIS